MRTKDTAEMWDICLEFLYSKEYTEGLSELLKKNNAQKILDCACGTGFPAIHLIPKQGFSVILSDGSKEMADRATEKIRELGLKANVLILKWQELDKNIKEKFDCVLCRGNSLVYADSWAENRINLEKARMEIGTSLRNFYNALKEGGICYIDTIPKKEFENQTGSICELFGKKTINGTEYSMAWIVKHDRKRKVRTWNPEILKWKNGTITNRQSSSMKSYLLGHDELEEALHSAGFPRVDRYVKIRGENHYDVFIAHKATEAMK